MSGMTSMFISLVVIFAVLHLATQSPIDNHAIEVAYQSVRMKRGTKASGERCKINYNPFGESECGPGLTCLPCISIDGSCGDKKGETVCLE